jgi:plasmid stabilization system protein ParE
VVQYDRGKGKTVKRLTLVFAAFVAIALPAAAQTPYEKTARVFFTNFAAGRFDAAAKDFNDKLRAAAPVATLKSMREQIESQAGAFQYISDTREMEQDKFRVFELIAEYEKSAVSVRVVFAENRIGAVLFNPLVAERIDPTLERVARELLASLTAGRFEAVGKVFDQNMREQLPPRKLAELARNVTETFGRFLTVTRVRQKTEPTRRSIELIAAYEKSPVKVSVVFDSQGGVNGLNIAPAAR